MLERYWYIACRTKELNSRPVGLRVMGKRLVLFRGQSGAVAALEDRCAHRNAPLSKGRVCNNTLQCPYHGWRYGLDGGLVEIPALPQAAQQPGMTGVKSFPCVEQDGYVWVSLLNETASVSPPCFPHLGESGWTSFHMKTRFSAPVEACLENFLDCPHATYVHKRWFRSPTNKKVRAVVRTLDDGAVAEYFEEPREKSLVWWLLSPKKGAMKHTDRFIAPNTSRVDYEFANGLHYIITSVCTPIDRQTTEVYTVITFKFSRFGPLIRLFFEPLSRIIIRQDVAMLDAAQKNINAFGGAHFSMSKADLLAPHIASWRAAIKDGTPLPQAQGDKDVELRL